MTTDLERRLKGIDKKYVWVAIIDFPGSVLVGLGLYAIFVADGDIFHPILK
jgi:hypothetical protein